MSRSIAKLDRWLYPDYRDNWDDRRFRSYVLERASPDDHLLDLGAGAGIVGQMGFRGVVAKACGIDLDPRVLENPMLDDAHVADAAALPFADSSFDLVIANNVLEHLVAPGPVFDEVFRVLRAGGRFLVKTPNRNHYVPLVARVTPHSFHERFNRRRGRASCDTFPTLYAVNTERQLRTHARAAGLDLDDIRFLEGRPEYLRFHPLAYLLGAAYERLVNAGERLRFLRVVFLATLVKSEG